MKILVTGGSGYIGKFMVKRLVERGDDVVVVDSLERSRRDGVDKRAIFVKGNIVDKSTLNIIFRENKIDAIIHFAGYISMEESVKNPGVYFHNNVFGSLELVEAAKNHNVRSFIFSSTAGVYGNPLSIPIPESHPANPTNPYGESKLMVEKLLSWYKKIFGLNFVSLRYFNSAGAALDGSIGEDHDPESHIIPLAIRAGISKSPFYLYGNDYSTPDGTCIRDYIHVLDLVDAHILSLEKLLKDKGGFFYNVGSGKGYSNREILDSIKRIAGLEIDVKISERRPGDASILVADSEKIKKELGFSPRYSDLDTIVETAWKWHKKSSKYKVKSSK
jgi:UDP-glucose 4-epimerase